jgi:putative heme-binding domain-containing protein
VPLDRQERYDNLVFPRGGGPGSLVGRGGGPNATEGERVFREVCAQCHRFGTLGKDFAPDLTKIADNTPRRDILRSIFFPSEKVDPKFASTSVTVKDGRTVRGLVVSETAQELVLKTAGEPEPVTVQKAQIAKRSTERGSIMPDDIADKVTDNGVRDVTAYIMRTIK